jgi:phosphomethylpyrimidine synthase
MKITQEVREYAAAAGLDERAALDAGMREKAAEFVSSGAELYQGELPAGAKREH